MEDVDFEGENEGDQVFRDTMNEIDDIEYETFLWIGIQM